MLACGQDDDNVTLLTVDEMRNDLKVMNCDVD